MRERPILFSAHMIRALLNGSKTQTRRALKVQPPDWVYAYNGNNGIEHYFCEFATDDDMMAHWPSYDEGIKCPYGKPGDQLWVRETFGVIGDKEQHVLHYRATHYRDGKNMGWKPSIYMPRWASRIQLEITNIRADRLNDCSEADAIAEGIEPNWYGDLNEWSAEEHGWIHYLNGEDGPEAFTAIESYHSLWESINGAGSWDLNPWVWVVEFKVIKPSIDWDEKRIDTIGQNGNDGLHYPK